MELSLVLATINRTEEVEDFFRSLCAQTYQDFGVIVVDQNMDDRLEQMLARYKEVMEVHHIHSEQGLSRARNAGLRYATGDLVAFPDDDCLYPPYLLEGVVDWFERHDEWDGLCGASITPEGMSGSGRWRAKSGEINRRNVWSSAISFSIFLRERAVKEVNGFDVTLGVGAGTPWGSGEETDYLLRAMMNGCKLFYDNGFLVQHPDKQTTPERSLSYGRGMGRVLKIRRYPLHQVIYYCIRPLAGALLAIVGGRFHSARCYCASFRGRVSGWLAKA